ncbi:MAG: uncharacterized protein JWR65_4168, partial [Massilia sp.]|nr:uncharacterized protein [Massilia sp.]
GRRLLEANLTNKPELLEEVIALLAELKSAWDAIGTTVKPVAVAAVPRPVAYDSLAPRAASFSIAG